MIQEQAAPDGVNWLLFKLPDTRFDPQSPESLPSTCYQLTETLCCVSRYRGGDYWVEADVHFMGGGLEVAELKLIPDQPLVNSCGSRSSYTLMGPVLASIY